MVMATTEERLQVLNMVAAGTITAEEGARLLMALEPIRMPGDAESATGTLQQLEMSTPRWFRVQVTELTTGRDKVHISLPVSLVEVAIRMGARFAPDLEGASLEQTVDRIKTGVPGKVLEVEDIENGERIEIYVE
jgi:hypothetical protein